MKKLISGTLGKVYHFKPLLLTILVVCFSSFVDRQEVKTVKAVTDPTPITKKVLVLNFNPLINGVELTTYKGWYDPIQFQNLYAGDVNWASHGFVNYQIIETQTIRDYPYKPGGYKFTNDEYLACDSGAGHCGEIIDYPRLINDYNLCTRVEAGEVDEVWLWGGPWFGYWEWTYAGPDIPNYIPQEAYCSKRFPIMGFSYERELEYMHHDLGHRAEGIMTNRFGYYPYDYLNVNLSNTWSRFWSYDRLAPGKSSCGNVHYPPNAVLGDGSGGEGYDYANRDNYVDSKCEDWLNYPSTIGSYQNINCLAWGCDTSPTVINFEKWWLYHLPHKSGTTNNKLNNWWSYVVDYDNAVQMETSSGERWYSIELGANDYNTSCGSTVTNANEIYMGINPDCGNAYSGKLKFPNVQVPKGANIVDAFLEIVADGPYDNTLNELVKVGDGTTASSYLPWTISTHWEYTTIVRSPSIKTAVQQLVNSTSWSSGKQMIVTLTHSSGIGQRRFFAVEREANAGTRLVIITSGSVTPTPTLTPTPTPTGSLLKNGGFELDANSDGKPDNWTANVNFTRNSTQKYLGTYSGRHFSTGNVGYNVGQTVSNLLGNKNYTFSGWMNIPSTTDSFTFKIQIVWKNSSGTNLRTDTLVTRTSATSGWVQNTATKTSPTGAAKAVVRMVISSLNATIYVDDFSFSAL